VRVLDAASGDVVARATGNAVGLATVKLPTGSVAPGEDQYALRVFRCGKPGTAETRFSTSFALGETASSEARILPTLEPVLTAR
jgi:hypothetical protein